MNELFKRFPGLTARPPVQEPQRRRTTSDTSRHHFEGAAASFVRHSGGIKDQAAC